MPGGGGPHRVEVGGNKLDHLSVEEKWSNVGEKKRVRYHHLAKLEGGGSSFLATGGGERPNTAAGERAANLKRGGIWAFSLWGGVWEKRLNSSGKKKGRAGPGRYYRGSRRSNLCKSRRKKDQQDLGAPREIH